MYYSGIPYASAPVGKLRFMPPVSSAHWSGVRPAHTMSPVCPQNAPPRPISSLTPSWRIAELDNLQRMLRNQSEDCLYLNIYTPISKYAKNKAYFTNYPNN